MAEPAWTRILGLPTPEPWLTAAAAQVDLVLLDHAHCERKAASTALSLMYRYPELPDVQARMSRLAREELRHFEQVLGLMQERGWRFRRLHPSRYAAGLHALVRTEEPQRLLDTLIVGALIEARSCERFAALAPHLESGLRRYYERLCDAEERHFLAYLELAEAHAGADAVADRLPAFRDREMELISAADDRLRFHSGPPHSGTDYSG